MFWRLCAYATIVSTIVACSALSWWQVAKTDLESPSAVGIFVVASAAVSVLAAATTCAAIFVERSRRDLFRDNLVAMAVIATIMCAWGILSLQVTPAAFLVAAWLAQFFAYLFLCG